MKFNRFEYESVVDGLKDWYLFHDAGAGTDCVVVLHGHGSHGDQLLIRPDLAPWLASLDRFGVSVVSPNLRDNAWMSPAAVSDLSRLLEEGKTRHRWRRIVFASMGGTGALIFAVRCPDLADALVILGAATDIGRYCNWGAGQTKPVLKEIHDAIRSVYEGEDYPLHNVCVHAASLTMPVWLYHGGRFPSPKRGRWLKSLQEKRIFIIMKLPARTTIPRSLFFNRDWKNFLLHREKDQNERLA